jgi:hypothetical protein
MTNQPALELRLEMEKPVEYRYRLGAIGQGQDGTYHAVLTGTEDAIRALGPHLFTEVRILLDLEPGEEAAPEPPPPPVDLGPVWEAVFPGLECGRRVDGTLWHHLSSGADDHEALLEMWPEDETVWVRVEAHDTRTGKRGGPADIGASPAHLRDLVDRKLWEYVARYSEGTEYSNEQGTDGRWRPKVRTEDLWTVQYVRRALAGMEDR